MEYMAAGKPVVSTRVGGVPELVEDGVHGLLVEPRDPVALAEAVARLLRDPDEASRMGANGRERQQREFSLDAMVGRIEDLYEELWLASGRRAGA
jgi:glycosyltransferase involved in cell wall biosynthesis